eukprot:2412968-Rhodomonas_salina.7
MPDTDLEIDISLRACYAMSGTDLAHGAIRSVPGPQAFSRSQAHYAMPGTDIAYSSLYRRPCPVLTWPQHTALCRTRGHVRY